MIKRMIVVIDEEKCTGCGKCVSPCAVPSLADTRVIIRD